MSVTLVLTPEQVKVLREILAQIPEPEPVKTQTPEEAAAEKYGIVVTGTPANQAKLLKAGLSKQLTELGGKPGTKKWTELAE